MITKRDFYEDNSVYIVPRIIRAIIQKNKNSIIDSTFKNEKYNYNKIPAGIGEIKFKMLMKKKENVIRKNKDKCITKKREAFRKNIIEYISVVGLD